MIWKLLWIILTGIMAINLIYSTTYLNSHKRLGTEMTTNARKWQGKFNELQRLVEEETGHREEIQSKLYMAEKRVNVKL